jgi:hypothetical protein
VEVCKNFLNVNVENATSRNQKLVFMLEQAVNVVNWINEFDPQNVNFKPLTLPTQLKELDDYSKTATNGFPKSRRLIEI